MKKLVLFLLMLNNLSLFAQTPDFNLQKYWFYRERFKNFFVSIGTNPGQGLAVSKMVENLIHRPNLVNDKDTTYGGQNFNLDDQPVYQGFYIGTLATEYALLKQNNRNTQEVLYELYCALYALNRLDMTEANIGNTALDGFMIREDFPNDFFELHPDLTATEAEREKWNVNSCINHNGYSNDFFHDIYDPSSEDSEEKQLKEAKRFGKWNEMAMSIDHYARILMGLALVTKFVGNTEYSFEYVNGNFTPHYFQDGVLRIKAEAQAISDRIVSYLKNNSWFLMMPDVLKAYNNIPQEIHEENCINFSNITWGNYTEPCRNCLVQPVLGLPTSAVGLGLLAPRGCSAAMAAWAYAKVGGAIQSDFDKSRPAYDIYNDEITTETRFFWTFFDESNSSGVLSYLSILAAVGDSKTLPLSFGFINTTKMDLENNDPLNYQWGFHLLLNTVLWDDVFNPTENYSLHRLNSAPCKGPDGAAYEWFEPNVFDTKTFGLEGDETLKNIKFNGLDYMLLFNLYLLKNPYYVDYVRFFVDDVTLTGSLPQVIANRELSFFPLVGVGAAPTGSLKIKPDPVEIMCLGKISSDQVLEHKNLSGVYQSFDFINFIPLMVPVETEINATVNVVYKATEDIEILPGFGGEEGNEYSFVAIEFKCNAAGNAYEMPLAPDNTNMENHLVADLSQQNMKAQNASNTNQFQSNNIERLNYSIAPNPNDGSFEVTYSNPKIKSETIELIVVDLFGKEIWKETSIGSSSSKWQVQLGASDKGMYIIKLIEGGQIVKTDKVVVK